MISYISWIKCLLAATVCMCISCNLTLGKVYYIIPSATTPCPSEPCLFLSQFAANSINYIKSNTALLLLPGNHSLEHKFEINNITSFELSGESMVNFEGITVIKCSSSKKYGVSNFNFYKILYIHILKIHYVGCTNIYASIGELTVANSDFDFTSNTYETTLEVVQSYVNITRCFFRYNSAGSS